MAESSSHNPSSPKITPKEEPVTLDKPKSPNPFLHADQIKFSFYEIAFTTNKEVSLLYHSHPNSEYFREVSDLISKCCLKETFIRTPTQYKEYLSEFWYTAKTLDDSKILVSTPTGGIRGDIGYSGEIRAKRTLKKSYLPPWWRLLIDYAKLIWEDIIHKLNKKTREKVVPYPMFISIILEYMMPEYDNDELTINPTQVVSVHNWALKPKQTKGPPFTDHMNFFHLHSESTSGHDASADSTVEVDPRLSAPNDSISSEHDQTKYVRDGSKTAHTDLDLPPSLLTPPQDEPIIVLDKSEEEEEVDKDKDTHATSHDVPEDTSIPHYPSLKLA
ncbi:hypothetical protein Tco_0561593 [Tanacetum coccineum]